MQEQRRSRRFPYRVLVDVHTPAGIEKLLTVDVARHGIFVASDHPPPERHMVQLAIEAPNGLIAAHAWVSRRVPRPQGDTPAGAGLQFFALDSDAKRRWDDFVRVLAATNVGPPPTTAPGRGPAGPASFVVKLSKTESLGDFLRTSVSRSATFLVTPVLKPIGARVVMHMVHPDTEDEFPLPGTVVRLHTQHPKGMEIRFDDGSSAQQAAFAKFIDSGVGPVLELAPTDVVGTEDIPPEFDHVAHTASEFDEGTLDEIHVATPSMLSTELAAEANAALNTQPFDVDIAESELTADQQFAWEAVDDDLLLDLDLTVPGLIEPSEALQTPSMDMVVGRLVSKEGPPADDFIAVDSDRVVDIPPELAKVLGKLPPSQRVRIRCSGCADVDWTLDVGRPEGLIGLLAETRPYWCPECEAVRPGVRLNSAARRRTLLEGATGSWDAARGLVAPLALALDVADLNAPVRCPLCSAHLTTTSAVRRLEQAIARLDGPSPEDKRPPCSRCENGVWSVEPA